MKITKSILLFTLIFLISSFSKDCFAQYKIDWAKAPLNPLPGEPYTLNHFNINGNVSLRKQGDVTYKFVNGKLISNKYTNGEDEYSYNKQEQLIQMQSSDIFSNIIKFTNNREGIPTAVIFDDLSSGMLYGYDVDGLFTSTRSELTQKITSLITYDKKNRILSKVNLGEKGKILSRTSYIYIEKNPNLLIIEDYKNVDYPKFNLSDSLLYNQNGHLISRNKNIIKSSFDVRGNILTYEDAALKMIKKYEYVYAAGNIVAPPEADPDDDYEFTDMGFFSDKNIEIAWEIDTLLHLTMNLQSDIKKLISAKLTSSQKIVTANNILLDIKRLKKRMLTAKTDAGYKAKVAESYFRYDTGSALKEIQKKLIDAMVKIENMNGLLQPQPAFENFDNYSWQQLEKSLTEFAQNMALDIAEAGVQLEKKNKKKK